MSPYPRSLQNGTVDAGSFSRRLPATRKEDLRNDQRYEIHNILKAIVQNDRRLLWSRSWDHNYDRLDGDILALSVKPIYAEVMYFRVSSRPTTPSYRLGVYWWQSDQKRPCIGHELSCQSRRVEQESSLYLSFTHPWCCLERIVNRMQSIETVWIGDIYPVV